MAYTPPEKDLVFFTGGLGNKSGKYHRNGGGCTKEAFENEGEDWSKFMGSNGSVIVFSGDNFTTITNNGSGKVRVTKSGVGFGNVVVGTFAILWDVGSAYDDYILKRVEVVAVSDNWCDVDIPYDGNESDISIRVGGALDSVCTIIDDNIIANEDYNRAIYSNLDEDNGSSIELAYGGKTSKNSWLSIIGCDANGNVLADDNYIQLGQQNGTSATVALNGKSNIRLKALEFHNVDNNLGKSIFAYASATAGNVVIDSCCFTSTSGKYPVFINDNYENILVINCVVENFGGSCVFYLEGGNAIHIFDSNIDANGKTAIEIEAGGSFIISGNIIKNATKAIDCDGGILTVCNNTFYNISEKCIRFTDTDGHLIEFNNIFSVASAGDDYAIDIPEGSVIYSGYSCTNASNNGLLNKNNLGTNYVGGSSNNTSGQLVNAGGGDFRLKTTSPCLNTAKSTVNNGYKSMGAWQRSQKIACRLIN